MLKRAELTIRYYILGSLQTVLTNDTLDEFVLELSTLADLELNSDKLDFVAQLFTEFC